MGGHPDALRRNKHGGLRAAVQDQLISRWRAMARIGVTTVWAAPDGRYIGAHGDGVRSPVADRGDDRKPRRPACSRPAVGYARHRIRHGIRHTAARAGRRPCPCVANGRLRHMLIAYARVEGGRLPVAGPAARRAAGRRRPTPNRDLIGQAETFDRSDRTVRGRSVPHGQPVNWPAYRPSRTRSQSSNA